VITLHPLMMGSNVPHGLGLDEITIRLLESSFQGVCEKGDEFARRFYERVLTDYPGLRPMFTSDPAVQRQKLVDSLAEVIEGLRTPDLVRTRLHALGARHAELGVKKEHYPIVCDYLLRSMRETLGPLWSSRLEQEWGRALVMISQIMLAGTGPDVPRPPTR
jgi:hemoglobin-like flavoprotein